MQTRYYDPEIGRFINADNSAVLTETNNHWGKNLYAYCDNNLVNRNDPTGEAWWNWVLSGLATVGGAALCLVLGAQVSGVSLLVGGEFVRSNRGDTK